MNPPLQTPEIIAAASEEEKQEYHQKGSVLAFSSTLHLYSSAVYSYSPYPLFSVFVFVCCCFFQMPSPRSCLGPSFSVFLILCGFSLVIHPGQATIPYKAIGSPLLASYFHIRSAGFIWDQARNVKLPLHRLCHKPCSLLLGTNSVAPPPRSFLSAVLAALSPLTSPQFTFSFFSIIFPFLSFLVLSSVVNHANNKHT